MPRGLVEPWELGVSIPCSRYAETVKWGSFIIFNASVFELSRCPTEAVFPSLSEGHLGSCVADCVTLVLARATAEARADIVELLLTGYYDAFAAAVAHVTSSAAAAPPVFSREQFAREVRRLAVHCGVATLHHKLGVSPNIPEEDVIALFTDVRKLCETSI